MVRILTGMFAALACAVAAAGPEVSGGVLGEGTDWETRWYAVDSGVEGPVVLITGGIHGNEPAGAYAAEQIRHWPVRKGKLVVVPRVNVRALEARVRRTPGEEVYDGDLNRAFPRAGEPNRGRTEVAEALWRFAEEAGPDWVIDLHEGIGVHRQDRRSVGSSIICRANGETRAQFERVLGAVNATIAEKENHFVLLGRTGAAAGSFARSAEERLGAKSAVFETTWKGFPLAVRVRQHRTMVNRLLRDLGVVEAGADELGFSVVGGGWLRAAVHVGSGAGGAGAGAVEAVLGSLAREPLARRTGASGGGG